MTIMPTFDHEGIIHWECLGCRKEGSGTFKLVAVREEPSVDDYLPVLAAAEAEHSLDGCNGSLTFTGAQRSRYVEHIPRGRK